MDNPGILYLMKTVIKGVYKIGISDENNFENRMRHLENNGYANVAGLKRMLAIKTDNYKEKEVLLHEIFSKSRIGDTELFAIDGNLVKRLFLSLRGEIVFPKNETAESEFKESIKEYEQEEDAKIDRKMLINLVKEMHRRNPSVLSGLLRSNDEYKPKNSKVRLFKEAYFGKSGTKLTAEIEEGLHIYATFSRADLEKTFKEYVALFQGKIASEY